MGCGSRPSPPGSPISVGTNLLVITWTRVLGVGRSSEMVSAPVTASSRIAGASRETRRTWPSVTAAPCASASGSITVIRVAVRPAPRT
jgi:hypothetical protein